MLDMVITGLLWYFGLCMVCMAVLVVYLMGDIKDESEIYLPDGKGFFR